VINNAARLADCEIKVANAEPAMPSAGIGPRPKMNKGLSAMSSATDITKNANGVFESPAPRKAPFTKKNA
jgi:hypothetical protein